MSSYSDIDLTIIDGVTFVLEKTRPPGGAQMTKGQIGCWRAHMDMMRYVVDHRLETALILEANVDWDMRIKDQLEELGKHMPGASKTRPYGLEWDMLYTGPSLHLPDEANLGPAIRYRDKTVGTLDRSGWDRLEANWVARDLVAYQAQDHERIVHRAYTTYATTSYMVTLDGARRILYQLGLNQQSAPVDVDFFEALHRRELNGLIVVPPLMQQWKTGDAAKDSDILDPDRASPKTESDPCSVQSMRYTLVYIDIF
ncbi:glycosyltransferase family 25 protein [Sclerotinia borealis F-4128]|uniref:Glycosyltransferase family 25 protein n=1 Tax=Sclerotinia borealis (strain F-4128) TaxID=1432307 RepID=W9C9F7_SCLBF|nr:glycosyltransferase family 25 protein [Sclerotinia borealis F-4128]